MTFNWAGRSACNYYPEILEGSMTTSDEPFNRLRRTDKEKVAAATAYLDGASQESVARKFRVTGKTLKRWLSEQGVKTRQPGNPRHERLSSSEKVKISNLYTSGLTTWEVADLVGRCQKTVRQSLISTKTTIRQPRGGRLYKLDEGAFDCITAESAYWAGFLMADGNVFYNTKNCPTISVSSHSRDEQHLWRFMRFLSTDSPVRLYDTPGGRGFSRKPGRIAVAVVNSLRLATALARFGVTPRKSLTAEVHHLADDRHFWRGVIDGDGTVCWGHCRRKSGNARRYPMISLCSGSARLIEQYVEFLKIHLPLSKPSIHKRVGENVYSVGLSCLQARKMMSVLYTDSPVALDRKSSIALEALSTYRPRIVQSIKGITVDILNARYNELGQWLAVEKRLGLRPRTLTHIRRRLGLLPPVKPTARRRPACPGSPASC